MFNFVGMFCIKFEYCCLIDIFNRLFNKYDK